MARKRNQYSYKKSGAARRPLVSHRNHHFGLRSAPTLPLSPRTSNLKKREEEGCCIDDNLTTISSTSYTPLTHTPSRLCARYQHRLTDAPVTAVMQRGLNSWFFQRLHDIPYQLTTGRDLHEIIHQYFVVGNDIFFEGELLKHLQYYDKSGEPTTASQSGAYPFCIVLDNSQTAYGKTECDRNDVWPTNITAANICANIMLYSPPLPHPLPLQPWLVLQHVNTAFHEMLHAWLLILVCKCVFKCKKLAHQVAVEGLTRHGIPWQEMAVETEDFLRDRLELEDADLNRTVSMALELANQSDVEYVKFEWERCAELGLEMEEVLEVLEIMKA